MDESLNEFQQYEQILNNNSNNNNNDQQRQQEEQEYTEQHSIKPSSPIHSRPSSHYKRQISIPISISMSQPHSIQQQQQSIHSIASTNSHNSNDILDNDINADNNNNNVEYNSRHSTPTHIDHQLDNNVIDTYTNQPRTIISSPSCGVPQNNNTAVLRQLFTNDNNISNNNHSKSNSHIHTSSSSSSSSEYCCLCDSCDCESDSIVVACTA